MKIILPLILAFIDLTSGEVNSRSVRCAVCKTAVEEMEKEIGKVNPNKKIQIGGYRIDKDGKLQEKLIPYARSHLHISELMDQFCKSMENYVRAKNKETGEIVVIKLLSDNGNMNPEISNVDIIQDSDLNKSLEFYCEGIVEEFESQIAEGLSQPSDNQVDLICSKWTNLCEAPNDTENLAVNEEL